MNMEISNISHMCKISWMASSVCFLVTIKNTVLLFEELCSINDVETVKEGGGTIT